jgi:hypothetical protein
MAGGLATLRRLDATRTGPDPNDGTPTGASGRSGVPDGAPHVCAVRANPYSPLPVTGPCLRLDLRRAFSAAQATTWKKEVRLALPEQAC